MAKEQQKAKANLAFVLTAEAFNECPLKAYQTRLKRALADVLKAAASNRSSSGITRFETVVLRESLCAVDWKSLCRQYDLDRNSKRNDNISIHASSALETALECLQNPTIWPFACIPVVLQVLLDVLVFGSVTKGTKKHDWSFSEKLVLKHTTKDLLCKHSHLLSPPNLLELWTGFIQRIRSPPQATRALKLWHVWFSEIPTRRHVWLKTLLELLARLDQLEHVMTQQTTVQTRNRKALKNDSNTREMVIKRKRSNGFNIQYLHGELSEDEESALAIRVTKQQKQGQSQSSKRITMKQVMLHDDRSNIATPESSSTVVQLLDLWKIKAKCIKAFLSSCRKVTWSRWLSVPRTNDPDTAILSMLMDIAVHSQSVRLCGILLVRGGSNRGDDHQTCCSQSSTYQALALLALSKAFEEAQNRTSLLSYYAEILSESSFFDNITTLWEAVFPLLQHIKSAATESFAANEKGKTETKSAIKPYLQCFAFLLSRRGNMLMASRQYRSTFKSFVSQLALSFDQASDWLAVSTPAIEYDKQLQSLRSAGILGVCRGDDFDAVDVASHQEVLPFPRLDSCSQQRSLRTVAECLIPLLMLPPANELFTQYSASNSVPPGVSKEQVATSSTHVKKREPSSPICIADYLDDDLLQNVFSFLNYKRMVRVRCVCSSWKECADNDRLWRSLYDTRYRSQLQGDDPLLATDRTGSCQVRGQLKSSTTWKQLFFDQWRAEKEVRFCYCAAANGWKVRVCGYVGCLQVLKTPKAMERHYRKHQRENNKKRKAKDGNTERLPSKPKAPKKMKPMK